MAKMIDGLLPSGRDVPFAEIEATLVQNVRDGRRRNRPPARALLATVIVVGPQQRLVAAAEALDQFSEMGGVRSILISEGEQTHPSARVTDTAVAVSGLAPRYLNNAVAALRLSSLPAAVWWRGGSVEGLVDLADLADRLILDTEEPDTVWREAGSLFERTALTDLRWTALTRWRSALAHLFDLPQVRRGAAALKTVRIEGRDLPSARLYAGWLKSSLPWPSGATLEIHPSSETGPPLTCVSLDCGGVAVTLKMREGRPCLEATAGAQESGRIVPTGDASLAALIGEELGVRTRDLAFERALVAAQQIAG
jgi:glucose-6-phosphate dehydrogenase assembly protein OpcA